MIGSIWRHRVFIRIQENIDYWEKNIVFFWNQRNPYIDAGFVIIFISFYPSVPSTRRLISALWRDCWPNMITAAQEHVKSHYTCWAAKHFFTMVLWSKSLHMSWPLIYTLPPHWKQTCMQQLTPFDPSPWIAAMDFSKQMEQAWSPAQRCLKTELLERSVQTCLYWVRQVYHVYILQRRCA